MDDLNTPFFMREEIRKRIQKRVDSLEKGYRQNVAMIGPEGMGKTPLLRSLYSRFARQSGIIPIYVHAQSLSFDHLVERWVGAVLWGMFAGQSAKPSAKIDSLLQAADPIAPRTVAAIRHLRKLVRKEKNATSIKELFALTGLLSEETGQQVVLMIDEFHELEALPTSDPFALLGKEIMVKTNTLYLVASSAPSRAHSILRDKLSLLFGNFEIISFSPLNFEEALDYMQWLLPGYSFSEVQKNYLIRLTDGHPRYLKYIAEELHTRLKVIGNETTYLSSEIEKKVLDAQIVEVLQRELIARQGCIYFVFEGKIRLCQTMAKDSSPYIRTLLALSNGPQKAPSIASAIEKRVRETKIVLQRLLKEEILSKKGAFYVLEDPLFCFWLREVFEKRSHSYEPDDQPIQDHLLEALQNQLELSRRLMKLEPVTQIEQLFRRFRNEKLEVEHKKIQCPNFTEIQQRASSHGHATLIAKSARQRWYCQIATEKITEEDIWCLQDEIKRYRKNTPRKLIIALNGMDQNAKLIAQESKIQIWDLRSLNLLFDLYGLPKMIRWNTDRMHRLEIEPKSESLFTA